MRTLRSVTHLFCFFFNDAATTEIYTLSLHDALPISARDQGRWRRGCRSGGSAGRPSADRKSTRLNSSHVRNLVCRLLLEKKQNRRLNTECIGFPRAARAAAHCSTLA